MRNAILVLFLSGLSISALAGPYGTPDQDPVVKDLRERFSKGKQPTVQQLLGKTFRCKQMMAKRDDFDKNDYTGALTFSAFDGYLQERWGSAAPNDQYHVPNGAEYISTVRIYGGIFSSAWRVDLQGYLINEWSSDRRGTAELEPVSSAAPNSKVISYTLCIPKL